MKITKITEHSISSYILCKVVITLQEAGIEASHIEIDVTLRLENGKTKTSYSIKVELKNKIIGIESLVLPEFSNPEYDFFYRKKNGIWALYSTEDSVILSIGRMQKKITELKKFLKWNK